MFIKIVLFCLFISPLFSYVKDIDQNRLLELDKQNKDLFKNVKDYTDSILKDEEKLVKEKLEDFMDDPESLNAKDINSAMKSALKIAKTNGLDTDRLKKLYELSKKVILRSEFKTYDEKTPSIKKFDEWVSWALTGDEKAAREAQKVQEQKAALYKKVSMAYIRALTQKDAKESYNSFKEYVQALQKIQSADADVLMAEANALVAEQQIVADAMSAVPLLGDAIDITAIASGEDMAGEKLSNIERGFGIVLLFTPNIIEQVIKRNPAVSEALGKVAAKLQTLKDGGMEKLSKMMNISKEKIGYVRENLKSNRDIDIWREHHYQKLREQQKYAQLPKETKDALISESKKKLDELKIKVRGRDTFDTDERLPDHLLDKISKVAKKRFEIIITRPVNKFAPKWLALGFSTKGMPVKGKSASEGLFAGLIPKKQKYSKLSDTSEIQKFQKKVDNSLKGERRYTNYTPDEIKKFEEALESGNFEIKLPHTKKKIKYKKEQIEKIIKEEYASPVVGAKQLEVPHNGKQYQAVELPKKGGDEFSEGKVVYKNNGKYYDENFAEIDKKDLKGYDIDAQEPFEVLTDPDGNPLTADLDLLTVGSKKDTAIMQNDSTMGNVNSNEMETITDINNATAERIEGTRKKKHPNQQLSHHGGESSFINSESKPDYPLVAHSPEGDMLIETDEQLKAYFHYQKLQGYNLEPNPFWNWGEWDPVTGYN